MRIINENTFDINKFRESKLAVNCKTKEDAMMFLEMLNADFDINWDTNRKFSVKNKEGKFDTYWKLSFDKTVYRWHKSQMLLVDSIKYIEGLELEIVEFKSLNNKKHNNNEVGNMKCNIQKNNITWDAFMIEDIVIHCKTEKETEELLCWILQNKKEMLQSPISSFADGWYSYKGDVCFEFDLEDSMICYGDKKFYNNQHYKILEWSGKNLYEINGTIETDMDIDELNNKFIDFIESINGEFAGGVVPC